MGLQMGGGGRGYKGVTVDGKDTIKIKIGSIWWVNCELFQS